MTVEKYNQNYAKFEEADKRISTYIGLMNRALSEMQHNPDYFHFTGISQAGIGRSPEATDDDAMDGRTFPDSAKIMKALSDRTVARLDMTHAWSRLSLDQRKECLGEPPSVPNRY